VYSQILRCRVCGNKELIDVLNLGEQVLTGIFPSSQDQKIGMGPLQLVKCCEAGGNACGLLQLKHNYALDVLYGDHYGYRSGLNQSMVLHLQRKVEKICASVQLHEGDIIIDVGSNDATTLKAYPQNRYRLIGIDPTAQKFAEFYTDEITPVFDFFNGEVVRALVGNDKVKVITSFSMFYDLEDPVGFSRDIASLLSDEGICVCEQSYMPTMLNQNSFDTVCHEHLEYYGLRQFQWIANQADLKILDVEFNDVNGGSFSVTLAKSCSKLKANTTAIEETLRAEKLAGLATVEPYLEFAKRIETVKMQIRQFFHRVKTEGKSVYGLGASTKGNVILQYCGITKEDLPAIGEVNQDKFGCYTPGSLIPILREADVIAKEPDYLFILPWHFKSFFTAKIKSSKIKLVYPLPDPGVFIEEEIEV
jgi:NDP-4-keto-2,6-dideoxyhexose 3-C-methyltransferase